MGTYETSKTHRPLLRDERTEFPQVGPSTGLDPVEVVARWGRSPVSPFHAEPGRTILALNDDAVAGYQAVRNWAVFPTGVVAPPGFEADAMSDLMAYLASARRRPVFAAVADPEPFESRGLHATRIGDDARIDLSAFSLSGKRMASIRHSVTSARRSGLRVIPWSPTFGPGVAEVSAEWLRTKRGGEMGFTLGQFDLTDPNSVDCRVAVDMNERVVGFVTWRRYDDGHGRVLDLMRRSADSPNPTMDLLIADSLLEFAAAGIEDASLGAVPLSHGALSERVYPTISLRRYKEKFAPAWAPLWLIAPSRILLPAALLAVASAYCPGGFVRALRRNA